MNTLQSAADKNISDICTHALKHGLADGALIIFDTKTELAQILTATPETHFLVAGSGGYGFIASVENMISRQKAGKAFVTVNAGETLCRPSPSLNNARSARGRKGKAADLGFKPNAGVRVE